MPIAIGFDRHLDSEGVAMSYWGEHLRMDSVCYRLRKQTAGVWVLKRSIKNHYSHTTNHSNKEVERPLTETITVEPRGSLRLCAVAYLLSPLVGRCHHGIATCTGRFGSWNQTVFSLGELFKNWTPLPIMEVSCQWALAQGCHTESPWMSRENGTATLWHCDGDREEVLTRIPCGASAYRRSVRKS
jgi:hypothetical protein